MAQCLLLCNCNSGIPFVMQMSVREWELQCHLFLKNWKERMTISGLRSGKSGSTCLLAPVKVRNDGICHFPLICTTKEIVDSLSLPLVLDRMYQGREREESPSAQCREWKNGSIFSASLFAIKKSMADKGCFGQIFWFGLYLVGWWSTF